VLRKCTFSISTYNDTLLTILHTWLCALLSRQVLVERNEVNLHSDILDTPEFFWEGMLNGQLQSIEVGSSILHVNIL
jgi:Uncharacterised ACR, YagE family COG1723